jgi:hypothetical protein
LVVACVKFLFVETPKEDPVKRPVGGGSLVRREHELNRKVFNSNTEEELAQLFESL